jgi:hypothetical protein
MQEYVRTLENIYTRRIRRVLNPLLSYQPHRKMITQCRLWSSGSCSLVGCYHCLGVKYRLYIIFKMVISSSETLVRPFSATALKITIHVINAFEDLMPQMAEHCLYGQPNCGSIIIRSDAKEMPLFKYRIR